jgi:hypothetical protein
MKTATESVYIHTLVAVFSAAFDLGFDPYALAMQTKIRLEIFDEKGLSPMAKEAEPVIDESLLVAKMLRC